MTLSTSRTLTPYRAILSRSTVTVRYGWPETRSTTRSAAPRMPAENSGHLVCLPPQHVGVVTEELQDHLRPRPGHELVDPALYRLAEAEGHPGNVGERVPHLLDQARRASGPSSTPRAA